MRDKTPLPPVVWATGWVSYLTDLSTEMIYGVLPAFYAATLHLSVAWMGLVEGFAEAVVSFTKLFSGHFSDRTGRRKLWMMAGYGLSAIAKPLLVLARGGPAVLALRGADRFGKGVRGAPRDALISRQIPADIRGRAFGVQRALDHAGALSGGLVGAALLWSGLVTLNGLFLATIVPGGLAVLAIALFVREEAPVPVANPERPTLRQSLAAQPAPVRRLLLVLGLFALGNSTDLLLLALARARFLAAGLAPNAADALCLLLWAWLHVVKTVASPFGGRLSDRVGRAPVLRAGWLVYALVYIGFALIDSAFAPWALFLGYGVYYGLAEGTERALVADLSPDPDRRGMAYGLFHFVTGTVALPASLLCGVLWQWVGPAAAFGAGAVLALVAAALLPWALRGLGGPAR